MGNSKSKKKIEKPGTKATMFDHLKYKEATQGKAKQKHRTAAKEPIAAQANVPVPVPSTSSPSLRFDDDAINRMRKELNTDSDVFLLNNILLSVQFFENYERESQHIKNNPVSDREHLMDEAMVRRHKHVFFADKLQHYVNERVFYQPEKKQLEPLNAPRLFIIYDNVEASEPGDTSDYSAVLDAPYYKLLIKDCKEPGYVKLQKLEVLESVVTKDIDTPTCQRKVSGDSVYSESAKESIDSDDYPSTEKDSKFNNSRNGKIFIKSKNVKVNSDTVETPVETVRRRSGPIKQLNSQALKSNISNIGTFKKSSTTFPEEIESITTIDNRESVVDLDMKPRKSILKSIKSLSGLSKEQKTKINTDNTSAEDTETSGYRSTTSSKQSETESDYGYSTIIESTTPKKLELTARPNPSSTSGVLPDQCWYSVQIRAIDYQSDDEDDETDDSASPLYITQHYLSSIHFMDHFKNNFLDIGMGLGMTKEAIGDALTQGASIYCDTLKNGNKVGCEIYPAFIAAWPNDANQWIIRERKVSQNPRTNMIYQWPTKHMVDKAVGLGCLLVPVGFRPKRGINSSQTMQWRITFPAVERYLEGYLSHAHIRCYLFALVLHKTFMENRQAKVGIDASHFKNHLFWQCEDNYLGWPEDRLGEAFRKFLESFYTHFRLGRFPNYFMDTCNDFKSIPKPELAKHRKQLHDILEAPVMHLLYALDKIKYTKKEFYPVFNCKQLYTILTKKNPLRILNPNLPELKPIKLENSDSDEDTTNDRNKDKEYVWQRRKQQRLANERRMYSRKQKAVKQAKEMNPMLILPKKMDLERRRLVLDFFISHFIAMARSSEKFEAINQAVIYLEQAQRLCVLLKEEPGTDSKTNEFQYIIRDKLADCQRKLVNQSGFNLPPRENQVERTAIKPIKKIRPKYQQIVDHASDAPTEHTGISAFTFVDIHVQNSNRLGEIRLSELAEESKL